MLLQESQFNSTSPQGTGAKPIFARHETFHPRYGWLKKGFDAANNNGWIFNKDDAPVRLGVGKNMVRSIRYWCDAFKLLEEGHKNGRSSALKASAWGTQLLSHWDPFLEDPASLWLLHWHSLKPPCKATAWWIAFNDMSQAEFTQDDLTNVLSDYCQKSNHRSAASSLKKDATCILRMYVGQTANSRSGPTEDSLDSPFTELGLLQRAGDGRHFCFRIGSKPSLPAEVTVAACLEYVAYEERNEGTVSISNLLYEPNSPGMVFKLTESALCEAIETVARKEPSIRFADSSGLLRLAYLDSPMELSGSILNRYYATHSEAH